MTRVLLLPASGFDLAEALRHAVALDCENFDEDARGVKRNSEGQALAGSAALPEPDPSRATRDGAPFETVRLAPPLLRAAHACTDSDCKKQAQSGKATSRKGPALPTNTRSRSP
jgi:hypothetical protein